MNKRLSITIPCYNQTKLLERNLMYLQRQTLKEFEIIILDDASSDDYPAIISKFPNLDITYVRNQKNLGAMGNIFNSIFYKTNTPYKISLHEDDALHPAYLENAVKIMDDNRNIVFVCALALWFKDDAGLNKIYSNIERVHAPSVLDKKGFIRKIIEGKHIMLSSAVYRNEIFKNIPDMNKYMEMYDVYCDRPLLTNLIGDQSMALIEDRAMFTRDHGKNDGRFKNVTENDAFNLMDFYEKNLLNSDNYNDVGKFLKYSTNFLLFTYPTIRHKTMSFGEYVRLAKKSGKLRFGYINKIGIMGLLRTFLNKKS